MLPTISCLKSRLVQRDAAPGRAALGRRGRLRRRRAAVVGTSAVVAPADDLISVARGSVIEVKGGPAAARARVALGLSGKAGEILPLPFKRWNRPED